MKKQEGYTLIFVLVTLAVVSTLALVVIGINLQTKRSTEIRKTEVSISYEARSLLNEGVAKLYNTFPTTRPVSADFKQQLEQLMYTPNTTTPVTYESLLKKGSQSIGTYQYKLVTSANASARDLDNVKIVEITAIVSSHISDQPELKRTYTQRVSLSTLPSFLYHVLGSENQLTLNGAPSIKGNVFSTKPIRLSQIPLFAYKGTAYSPTIAGNWTAKPIIEGIINVSPPTPDPALKPFQICNTANKFCSESVSSWQDASEPISSWLDASELTRVVSTPYEFSSLNYLYSFIEYLHRHNLPIEESNIATADKQIDVEKLRTALPQTNGIKVLPITATSTVFDESLTIDNPNDNLLVTNASYTTPLSAILLDQDIGFSESPLILNGNLSIQSVRTLSNPLKISRPLIVIGDLKISGNVAFNTTIFVLGKTTIDDANISSIENNSMVLLSKGELLINRFDKFSQATNEIEAFLYSDAMTNNRIYTVGSNLSISGGLFTKGNLTINTFRGSFTTTTNPTDLTEFVSRMRSSSDRQQSRLQLNYDANIIKNQLSSLPVTDRIHLYVEPPQRKDTQ